MEENHSHFSLVLLKGKVTSMLVNIHLFPLKVYYVSIKEQLEQHVHTTKACSTLLELSTLPVQCMHKYMVKGVSRNPALYTRPWS